VALRWAFVALVLSGCDFRVGSVGPSADLAGGRDFSQADLADLAMLDQGPPPDLTPDPCAPAPSPVANSIIAHCSLGDSIVIDGDLSDWPPGLFTNPVQHHSPGIEVSGAWAASETQNDRNLSGSFAARWDNAYLYIAFQITDDIRKTQDATLWMDDAAEVYIDGVNDRGAYMSDDDQLVFAADGRAALYRGGPPPMPIPANVIYAARDTTGASWNLEVAVPWGLIGGSSTLGRVLGFDIQLDDDDSGTGRDRFLTWHNLAPAACNCNVTCEPFCDTRPFYNIQLSGR
jgi:hypothetical protein